MNILVIGSGGREHALCWKLRQSPLTEKLYCAPGNAGIADVAECINIGVEDGDKLVEFAKANNVEFAVVGPEAPLCAGVGDKLRAAGLRVFGPNAEGAQLEGSKDFAKQFMNKYNIPTARSATFTDAASAKEYINTEFAAGAEGIVVKADGLAAGKGVLVADAAGSANAFVDDCFGGAFGKSGATVLIEECLFGEEASILALTDGKTIVPLVTSQDHKRIFDDDQGPNTGGMGAYSPAPVVNDQIMAQIKTEILDRFLAGIQAEKIDYRGVIFVGIMVTGGVAKVLEFNVRFGDPEIQPVVRRFDGDWADALYKTADGRLDEAELIWSDDPAVSVVIAAGGYPGSYRKGDVITGLADAADAGAVVFHAGTAFKDGAVVSAGGRVLGVSARGKTIQEAIANAYKGVEKIHFADCFSRKDIGAKALKYLK